MAWNQGGKELRLLAVLANVQDMSDTIEVFPMHVSNRGHLRKQNTATWSRLDPYSSTGVGSKSVEVKHVSWHGMAIYPPLLFVPLLFLLGLLIS